MQFFIYSLTAFIAGVLSFLSPCSFALIPAYFAYHTKIDKKSMIKSTILFAIGFSIVFILFGVMAGSVGKFLLLYKKEIMIFFGFLIIIFGIYSLFGKSLFHFDLKSSFLFGSIVSMTWSGCIGPMLGIILILAAASGTAVSGGFLLLLYSLGLLFPLIMLSIYLEKLPKNIWDIMKGKLITIRLFGKELNFHTTNIISSLLFITFGIFLLFNLSTNLTNVFYSFSDKLFDIQDYFIEIFNVR